MKVSRDMITRLRSNLPAAAPRERAVLDLCEAALEARDALRDSAEILDRMERSATSKQRYADARIASDESAALRSVLEMLDSGSEP